MVLRAPALERAFAFQNLDDFLQDHRPSQPLDIAPAARDGEENGAGVWSDDEGAPVSPKAARKAEAEAAAQAKGIGDRFKTPKKKKVVSPSGIIATMV